MGKFRTTLSILLALIIVSLSAAGAVACTNNNNNCNHCDSCNHCDKDDCCCKAKEPTWQDWFNAFQNDGFWNWAGMGNFNFAGIFAL